jgi:hypothetical protein
MSLFVELLTLIRCVAVAVFLCHSASTHLPPVYHVQNGDGLVRHVSAHPARVLQAAAEEIQVKKQRNFFS